MKTVLFCPGFGDGIDSIDYASVLKAIEDKGHNAVFVSLQWKRTTITDWVKQLEVEYQKYDAKDVILAGFSFGSTTALMAASCRNPAALWLFSLSPYFAEDIPDVKKSWAYFVGKRRMDAFKELGFSELAKDIHCPTTIVVGEREDALVIHRAHDAHNIMKSSKLLIVPGAGHNVADKNYIETIRSSFG